jgi:hypothetical protein
VIFNNYALPVAPDFCLDHLDQKGKVLINNDLTWYKESFNETNKKDHLDQVKPNEYSNNSEWSKWSKENSGIGEAAKTNGNNHSDSDREVFEI